MSEEQDKIAVLERDLAEMKRKYGFTYCAYCGVEFQIDAPESVDAVSQHIATCDKHPMRIVEKERDQLAAKCETFYEIIKNYGNQNLQRMQSCNESGSIPTEAQETMREPLFGLPQKDTERCNSGESERSRVEKETGRKLAQKKRGQPGAVYEIPKEVSAITPGEISEGLRKSQPDQATLQDNSQKCDCERVYNSPKGMPAMQEDGCDSRPSRRLHQAIDRAVAMSYLSHKEAQEILDHALSDQCGEGWLSPDKAGRLREALNDTVNTLDGAHVSSDDFVRLKDPIEWLKVRSSAKAALEETNQ